MTGACGPYNLGGSLAAARPPRRRDFPTPMRRTLLPTSSSAVFCSVNGEVRGRKVDDDSQRNVFLPLVWATSGPYINREAQVELDKWKSSGLAPSPLVLCMPTC
jgi:hypothetical protein